MNEPREPVRPQEWDEVQRAYREAPTPVPAVQLDARVRAAVEAELAARTARPQAARVVPFRPWSRLAVPLAAAATIVVAVGVAWLGRTGTTANTALVASAPVPDAELRADEAASITDATKAAGTAREERLQAQAQVQRKAVAQQPGAPPVAAVIEVPAAAVAPAPVPAGASDRAEPVAARTAVAPAANGTLAAGPMQLPPPSLEQVRQLLRDGQHDAARAVFMRWREAYAVETVPDDLKALAEEVAR
jgi:hypothetical protein